MNEVPKRRKVYLRNEEGKRYTLPAFYDKEDVTGEIAISLTSKKFDHSGIKIELLGLIECAEGQPSQFISLSKEISPPSTLINQVNKFKFSFANVEKQFETFHGNDSRVKYILRAIIKTTLRTLTWEREFGVINPIPKEVLNENNEPIKMEVGIEDWLHLSFNLDKSKFGTKDCITGKVEFKKVSMKLKNMLIQIIRKETTIGQYEDSDVICRYEIMDGAPVKNETVPIRFFLSPYELTPTYENVNNKFAVQYFINLVLYDSNDKRYFKQHEIFLYRIPRISPQREKERLLEMMKEKK